MQNTAVRSESYAVRTPALPPPSSVAAERRAGQTLTKGQRKVEGPLCAGVASRSGQPQALLMSSVPFIEQGQGL